MQTVQDNEFVISARHLTKKFGDETAVQDVSFEVPRGFHLRFYRSQRVGKNHHGPYVDRRLCSHGRRSCMYFDRDPAKLSRRERIGLGYMPQLFVLYTNLTVWENLNFAASLYGMSLFRRRRLKEALKFVELYEHRSKLARNISGGMLRRLSLASTLVHDPQLLFLDEPTAGIDPVLRRKFWDHFRELKDQGRTIFITTQYVSEADNCDLVGVQNNGKLLLVDTPRGDTTSRLWRRYDRFSHDGIHSISKLRLILRSMAFVRAKNIPYGSQQHANYRRPCQYRHSGIDELGAATKYSGAGGGGIYAVL